MNFKKERRGIVGIGKALYARGFVVATDGNISVRVGKNKFLATPAGVCKGKLRAKDLIEVQLGKVAKGVSSEIYMHFEIYAARPDINAIVHAHSPFATAFACAGRALSANLLPEALIRLRDVPLVEYAPPGSILLAKKVASALKKANCALMANHGAVAVGRNLKEAFYNTETLEHLARVSAIAKIAGKPKPLSKRSAGALKIISELL